MYLAIARVVCKKTTELAYTNLRFYMDSKIFTHVVTNVLLFVLVVGVAVTAFSGAYVSVFGDNNGSPIYRGKQTNAVSFMINVYWGTEYIDDMLEILSKYNVKATFFVGGYWVAKYPNVLCKIVENGHEIGNHGYFHKQHSTLTLEQNKNEIISCEKVVYETCGVVTKLFAPPSGDFGKLTLSAAESLGYKIIMWSKDTVDWRDKNAELIFSRATKDAQGGDLILMHPTRHTLHALENMVKYYLEHGFDIVKVGDNLGGI